jgi:peptidoglycan/xylan/chitin deacetylase (PgdA/CDA1 family)
MAQTPPAPWPENCRGAISLTFDDGHPTHLEKALPILAEYDLRATFYLNPRGDDWLANLAPWRDVARAGQEGRDVLQLAVDGRVFARLGVGELGDAEGVGHD